MILKKLRTRGRRVIAAVVCTLAVTAPASVAVPATAHAATCAAFQDGSDWDVPYGCNNVVIPGSHRCTQVTAVDFGTIEGDECADIVAQNTSGIQQVWGQGEFYCQGTYTQCGGLNVTVDMSWTDDASFPGMEAATTAPARFTCNPNPGPACVTSGRNYVRTTRSDNMWGYSSTCVQTYSWDPYDGWNDTEQVFALKNVIGADHVSFEWDSGNVHVCLLTH